MQLDNEVLRALRGPIHVVWRAIGNDVLNPAWIGPEADNESAVSACLSPDRLWQYTGSKEYGRFVTTLVAEHGYGAVVKFLSDNILLV